MCLRYINDVTYKFSIENRGNQVPNIYEHLNLYAYIVEKVFSASFQSIYVHHRVQ